MAEIAAVIRTADRWQFHEEPLRVLQTTNADDVSEVIAETERLVKELGKFAAGFVSYEAARAYGLTTVTRHADDVPLAWFAVFDRSHVTTAISSPENESAPLEYALGPLNPSVDRSAFDRAFETIKEQLAAGNSYQVNYTFRMRGAFSGEPRGLFQDLVRAQAGGYAAFLDIGSHAICSASPELFFSREAGRLVARPMKGTSKRGRTTAEDARLSAELKESPKQRAENVMIVDMVRNDLGRIASVGSVSVPELFTVERYPNVWQMTSTVAAESSASLPEIFAALHPSASVTGAPKASTMKIIAELEGTPRGVYTGAVGYLAPDGTAQFNVAIRTAAVNRKAGTIEFGVGSGVVWDSHAGSEYEESLLKGSILSKPVPPFDLLETIKWDPAAGFVVLDRHLARLADSAAYFGHVCDTAQVREALEHAVRDARVATRLRVLAGQDGKLRVEQRPFEAAGPARVRLAAAPVDASDVFLFHKTTNRSLYERHRLPDCDDVVLWNTWGEVTETTIANLVAELDGRRWTPPVDCGLLAGTFRAELLERGEIAEAVLTIDDLRRATRFWMINSVQGWRDAVLVE